MRLIYDFHGGIFLYLSKSVWIRKRLSHNNNSQNRSRIYNLSGTLSSAIYNERHNYKEADKYGALWVYQGINKGAESGEAVYCDAGTAD